MILIILNLICISSVTPVDSLILPQSCATVVTYNNNLYVAPFTGNSFYHLSANRVMNITVFADAPRVRIIDFAVTPFAFFINTGQKIVRYYRRTMEHDEVIRATSISSFAITESEELIYADPRTRTVHFLDYTGKEKSRLEDVFVRDMAITDSLIYLLTPAHVIIYDKFGNELRKVSHAGSFSSMYIQNGRIFLFSHGQQQLHIIFDQTTITYGLPVIIQDVAGMDTKIYVLNERGTVLYLFNSTDF